MYFKDIYFIPDLLRGCRIYPDAFFDLLQEPILQSTGLCLQRLGGTTIIDKVAPRFNLEQFKALCQLDNSKPLDLWSKNYHSVSELAEEYLCSYISDQSLILSFEMPVWLQSLCKRKKLAFVDIRVSPLRFASDLYIALRTNIKSTLDKIIHCEVSQSEIRLEASQLAASVRLNQRRYEDKSGVKIDLNNTLIWVAQAPHDAAILSATKVNPLSCVDFSAQLRLEVENRELLYKPHPLFPEASMREMVELSSIMDREVRTVSQNAYQILSCKQDLKLVGISSGLLQEAKFFDAASVMLYKPLVPLVTDLSNAGKEEGYRQVHFGSILSPIFWSYLLGGSLCHTLPDIGPRIPNQGRHLLDTWWDYAKVLTWERQINIESFERSGGSVLRRRIEALQNLN